MPEAGTEEEAPDSDPQQLGPRVPPAKEGPPGQGQGQRQRQRQRRMGMGRRGRRGELPGGGGARGAAC